MEVKKKYIAPAILEEFKLENSVAILSSSKEEQPEIDKNFDKVETMGQEIGGTIGADEWSQTW